MDKKRRQELQDQKEKVLKKIQGIHSDFETLAKECNDLEERVQNKAKRSRSLAAKAEAFNKKSQ